MSFRKEKSYWQQAVSPREYRTGILIGAALAGGVAFVFYNSAKAMILAPVILPFWMRWWDALKQSRKKRQFEREFRQCLQSLEAALQTGRSFENAMRQVTGGTPGALRCPMAGKEFSVMCRQLEMNVPVETVWENFAGRCPHPDVREMALVITSGKRAGGNLIRVMRRSISQITQKMEVQREIETVLAARRLELRLMLAMPFAILLYMRMAFSGMMSLLYGSLPGVIVMTLCLGLYAAAGIIGHRIVRIAG